MDTDPFVGTVLAGLVVLVVVLVVAAVLGGWP